MEQRSQQDQDAINKAGLTHVDIAPTNPVLEEDDFLAGKKACSVNDPDCESCQ